MEYNPIFDEVVADMDLVRVVETELLALVEEGKVEEVGNGHYRMVWDENYSDTR